MRHVDRISTLPDDVITNSILSLLPTKDSVRTSALSTRWKHLYASVRVLKFTDWSNNPNQTDPTAFAGFVSNVLNTVINKLSRVSQFYVSLDRLRVTSSVIVSWIETVTSHSVQKLDVYGFEVGCMPTPHSLFTCETLVSLNIDIEFVLSVPDVVRLPNLKYFVLKDVMYSDDESDDEAVKRLFSGCPVLESLTVVSGNCYYGRVFDVSVPSLKILRMDFFSSAEVQLSINCPNLEEMKCGSYATRGYSGDVFGSLKKCDIDLVLDKEQFEQGKLIELVRQVCKVRFLSLSGESMQALLISSASLPTFENLIHLELESSVPNGWRLLPSILDCSPRLRTLVFPNGFLDPDDYVSTTFLPPEHVPVCLSFHLKVIRLDKFIGEEVEYKWVEFFLTNALVLEKMEICLKSSEHSEEENDPLGEGEGEVEGGDDGEGDGQGQEHEQGQGQEEEEGYVDPDVERNFEIGKRLLNFQRSSEVCQLFLVLSAY